MTMALIVTEPGPRPGLKHLKKF